MTIAAQKFAVGSFHVLRRAQTTSQREIWPAGTIVQIITVSLLPTSQNDTLLYRVRSPDREGEVEMTQRTFAHTTKPV